MGIKVVEANEDGTTERKYLNKGHIARDISSFYSRIITNKTFFGIPITQKKNYLFKKKVMHAHEDVIEIVSLGWDPIYRYILNQSKQEK